MKRIFFVVLLAFVLLAGCKKDVRVETSDLSQASPRMYAGRTQPFPGPV